MIAYMEIDPTPVGEYLAEVYSKLPMDVLAVERARIRVALGDLAGKLVEIKSVMEATSNEHPVPV
jgi:hypothetical protein